MNQLKAILPENVKWGETREEVNRYRDRTLVCAECGREYTWTAGEQEYFHDMKYADPPKRCADCRRARKERRDESEKKGGKG